METRTLKDWAVFECEWPEGTGEPTQHLVGTCLGQARCSSAVVIDVATRSGISTKGNVYKLRGEPGLRLHAMYVWQDFVAINSPVEVRDITEELFPDLVALLSGPESVPGSETEDSVGARQQAVDRELPSEAVPDQAPRDDRWLAENHDALHSSNQFVDKHGLPLRDLRTTPASRSAFVVGEIVEVLPGLGLAHLRTADGTVYGLSRNTPGVAFDSLQAGQRLRCEVTERFHRVLRAETAA